MLAFSSPQRLRCSACEKLMLIELTSKTVRCMTSGCAEYDNKYTLPETEIDLGEPIKNQ